MCIIKTFVYLCPLVVCAQAVDLFESQKIGIYSLVLNSDLIKCNFNKCLNLDVSLINIYMYDFANNINKTFRLNETRAFLQSYNNFDANRTTIVYVPGFTDAVYDSSNNDAVRTNLANVPKCYLYMIDHHNYTYRESYIEEVSSYERSVEYGWDIGKAIAKFLIDLINCAGIDYNNSIVMGHSLGGQIIAAVGEVFINITNNMLPALKGLDPAGPCYNKAPEEFQLRSGLARSVETYHCNAGQLGTTADNADANYYINGGHNQPGCDTPIIPEVVLSGMASSCSHNACPKIVTMKANETDICNAIPCSEAKTCSELTESENNTTRAGLYSDTTNSGLYYIITDL